MNTDTNGPRPDDDRQQTTRCCLIPDLDDQLVNALAAVEELLLTLAAWEEDVNGAGPFVLPAPLGGRVALDALNRVQNAVTPTQTRTDRAGHDIGPTDPAAHGRLLGPDGRYEHLPLRLLTLERSDLDVLAAAAAALGRALATPPTTEQHDELVEALHAGADAAAPAYGPAPSAGELVEGLARAHGLLDLADTDDTTLLRRRLVEAGGRDVVLTPGEENAYQRLAERANTMWTSRDPLARWLY